MIRYTISFLSLLFCLQINGQELSVGDVLPSLPAIRMINRPGDQLSLASLKGKVVILDFWATWCSPCVAALGRFEKLRKEFGDQLSVVAVSDEERSRLKQFIANRPTSLWIGNDTANRLFPFFPHKTIPHTILIDPEGKIEAITDAENITPDIIRRLLKKQTIALPVKKDNTDFSVENYFKADTTQSQMFNMLPAAQGVGTMSRVYPRGFFKDRRITIVNMTMPELFRFAYEKSRYLLFNEYDTVKRKYADQQKYCVDCWIPETGNQCLLDYFRNKLKEQFIDVEAVTEKRKMKVLLIRADSTAIKKLKPSTLVNDRFNAGGSSFEGNGVKLSSLAEYLEDFGLYKGKVIDATGIDGRYDIFFEWQPENTASLKAAFEKFGLYREEGEREVEVLILRRKRMSH